MHADVPKPGNVMRSMTERSQLRTYSEAERAEAVALSLTIGADAAATRLGIPRRNISRWRRTPSPAVAGVIESSAQDVAAKLWEVVDAGATEALRRIRDPETRAGELAQLLKVAAEQHALLTGDVTARTETRTRPALSDDEQRQLREFLDSIEQHLDAGGDPNEITAMVRGVPELAASTETPGEETTDGE